MKQFQIGPSSLELGTFAAVVLYHPFEDVVDLCFSNLKFSIECFYEQTKKRKMNKLLEYGRKAWFIIRVMSGYEERRIRAYRLQLGEKIQRAQARQAKINRLPEEVILSEIRRMVEEMQGLNRVLEETEAKIDEHFKPIDEAAKRIMDMQMEKEERQNKEMMKFMQNQIMMQREAAMRSMEAANQRENRDSHVDVDNPSQHDQEQKK